MINFPLIIRASTAIITNSDGKILILKRSWSHKSYPFFWQFPEGKLLPNESALDCAKRELYEETHIKCKLKYLKTMFLPIAFLGVKFVVIKRGVYMGQVAKSKVKLSQEHSKYVWITKEELSKYCLVPGLKKALQG